MQAEQQLATVVEKARDLFSRQQAIDTSIAKSAGDATDGFEESSHLSEREKVLARDVDLPEPETGELLALPASGAYCLMMASNYNMQTRPAVVLVNQGESRLIRRRETYTDLLASSIDLD